jgi:hypothetical protein
MRTVSSNDEDQGGFERAKKSCVPRIDFYRHANVRERIREFIGMSPDGGSTAEFISASDDTMQPPFIRYSTSALDVLLDGGFEICRSLWDHTGLIADFDIEYVNFDSSAEAFVDSARVFAIQQPVAEAIEHLLHEYGIDALHLLSGRGHHFVWRVAKNAEAFRKLTEIACGPSSLWNLEGEPHPPNGRPDDAKLARAFAGLGLVMEFLAHRVKQIAAPVTEIPVGLTAVEVGPGGHGREMISIDVSEYGDPLYSRAIRVPFSVYLKPWQQPWGIDANALANLSPIFVLPLQGMNWKSGIWAMRDPRAAAQLASHSSTVIPDASNGLRRLLADYEKSRLAEFHSLFYSQEQHSAEEWPKTYDKMDLEILPDCVRVVLEQPNDLLLRPGWIRRVVHVLLALGWHPRHIAGLISSKYQRDFQWSQFVDVDPAARADFYTRLFAGLFVDGTDDLVDLNCASAQEQGTCTFTNCGCNLAEFRGSALERRKHDQLAHRPFNRLFLSSRHP